LESSGSALTLLDMAHATSTHLVGRIHVDLGRVRSSMCRHV